VEDSVDELEQLAGSLLDLLEIGKPVALAPIERILLEHLAVADDLAERRAHLVLEPAHDRACLAGDRIAIGHAHSIRHDA
jgi:hypothetical protein